VDVAECAQVRARASAERSIIFADESGDHGLPPLNPEYPVFVLALCLVDIDYYIDVVCPLLQNVKFKYFGHDGVILHERDIRKHTGAFSILRESVLRENFHRDMSQLIESLEFKIFATVIDKREYQASGLSSQDMYFVAMSTSPVDSPNPQRLGAMKGILPELSEKEWAETDRAIAHLWKGIWEREDWEEPAEETS
jgi:hypothetical protein